MAQTGLPEEDRAARLLALVEALRAELRAGGGRASLRSSLERDLGLDSLARGELLLRVEAAFGVRLPEGTLGRAETPGDLLAALGAARGEGATAAVIEAPLAAADILAPADAATLAEVLLWHAGRCPEREHIRFLAAPDHSESLTYGGLLARAERVAAGLAAWGLQPGQAVAIMLPTSLDFFAAFYGTLLAGGVPAPLYPPASLSRIADHLHRQAGILANCQAPLLLTVAEARAVSRLVEARVETLRAVLTLADLPPGPAVAPFPAGPGDLALLQYTSGSTGNPKGVMLSHANLLANIRAWSRAAALAPADVCVSWLPLYHDMGLIGTWLGSLYNGCRLVLQSPLTFLARPEDWLWAIHRYRGSVTAAPNFAFELCLRRLAAADLAGLDLSSWRLAANGAEPVSPDTVERFCAAFAPFGFRRESLLPVYGLAECAVGLAVPPLGQGLRIDRVDRHALARGEALPAAADDANPQRLVACGRPLPGHELRVVGTDGAELPERRVGRLQFRGPSATAGYYRNPEATRQLIQGAWRETGDLAYLADSDLFLASRSKDMIIRAGRNLYPYELEEAVGRLPGIRRGCVAVFGTPDPASGSERLVVLAETRETGAEALVALRQEINRLAVDILDLPADDIVLAPPGAVLKTSSGKLRRAALRDLHAAGRLGGARPPPWRQLTGLAAAGAGAWLGRLVRQGLHLAGPPRPAGAAPGLRRHPVGAGGGFPLRDLAPHRPATPANLGLVARRPGGASLPAAGRHGADGGRGQPPQRSGAGGGGVQPRQLPGRRRPHGPAAPAGGFRRQAGVGRTILRRGAPAWPGHGLHRTGRRRTQRRGRRPPGRTGRRRANPGVLSRGHLHPPGGAAGLSPRRLRGRRQPGPAGHPRRPERPAQHPAGRNLATPARPHRRHHRPAHHPGRRELGSRTAAARRRPVAHPRPLRGGGFGAAGERGLHSGGTWHITVHIYSYIVPVSATLPAYAELHCLSNFTFLRGASHPDELVARAAEQGYSALALTDECSLAGVVRGHLAAKAVGLRFIVGSEFVLADGLKLVLLACNRAGYGNLSALITLGRRRAEKGCYHLTRGDLESLAPSGAVPDCLALWVPPAEPAVEDGCWLAERFPGRAWIAVELHAGPDDGAKLEVLQALGGACALPLVAAGDVHMHERTRRPVQDVLTALRLKTTVFEAGYALFPNGERHLRARLRLARLYPPELLAETLAIAGRCSFSLEELRYEYPEEIVPAGETPASWLRAETEWGLARRYPAGVPAAVAERVEHELALIAEMAYEAYFLTVYDIVRFARSQGILCQGRGSAANSAVCYALGVTEVDPARSQLLFERFISRERGEPPDIDVDFEHERREEVIQYIYGKYGRERAALAAALITYRTKGALRDTGRALGFGIAQIDALTASLAWWDKRDQLPARFAEQGLDPASPRVAKWLALAEALRGFPRHLTQHVGGFVISRGPLSRLVPVENAAMAERSVIQWDKDDLDAIGLMKVDVLALGMLSAIRRTLELVAARRGEPFGLADIPAEDPAVYAMLGTADSMGVFQVESRAQMAMLPRLKPVNFYDLVIEVSLVRPGPIQGGMVHPYLKRRAGEEPVEEISPAVDAVLERTLGVPIFQEQVMQLAVVAANFTPGEADQLRRSMAAWKRKGGLEPFERKLLAGMAANGLPEGFARRIIAQIQGFGEYGFPESHAASFALLVYASAWLKRHEPAAFLCGLLNSQPMGFYSPSQLVQDAGRHGVAVGPVDVAASGWDSTLEADGGVRLGLREIVGFARTAAERIVAARRVHPFVDVGDLAARAALSRRDLDLLAAADALASLAGHRRQAAWAATAAVVQGDLFDGLPLRAEATVELPAPSEGENLVADYRSLGLTLRRHPLALLRERLAERRFLTAGQLQAGPDRMLARAAGIVTGRQRPGTATGIVFVTLEDETGYTNVVVRPELAEKQRRELLGARLLGVYGQLEAKSGVVHLLAKRLVDLTPWLGRLSTASRDFH